MAAWRVVIGGPRGSGKSTVSASTYVALKEKGGSVGIHEIDVYSDSLLCILGAKPWAQRKKRKWAWFDPTIKKRIAEYEEDTHDIVLGDLPGKITNPFLSAMVAPAHAAIIVSRTIEDIAEWEAFFAKHNIPVVLRIFSVKDDIPEHLQKSDMVLIDGLDRCLIPRDNQKLKDIVAEILNAHRAYTAASVPLVKTV